ncbi:MAG TPA: hypothetical protein VL625_03815 [Patescibacteria group bacterium]|nr:hypothetical protein [Patescibacteria group bacterium]
MKDSVAERFRLAVYLLIACGVIWLGKVIFHTFVSPATPRTIGEKTEQCDFALQYTAFEAFSLYINREGAYTSKDFKEAFGWCEQAANAGSPLAQATLAELYDMSSQTGGVPKDDAEAYFWLSLAQKSNPAVIPKVTNLTIGYLRKQLTKDQIAIVDRRVQNWKPVRNAM